jgi:uncharacterized phiE125 gp8 family phage protein
MGLSITTPAASTPVVAADLRAVMRTSDTSEDTLLTRWIKIATTHLTKSTGYTPLSTTFRLDLDEWADRIILPRYPVTSVTGVQYRDTNGDFQTLSGTTLDTASRTLWMPESIPSLHHRLTPVLRITFVAGHALAADVDPVALGAILMLSAHLSENREAYTDSAFVMRDVPLGWQFAVEQLAGTYGVGVVYE